MKPLYLALRARIEEKCPSIQHVRLFNNQYKHEEAGEQIPYPKPAVFIEFPNDVQWIQHGKGIQNAENVTVRLHLVHEFYNGDEQGEDLLIFDLRDELFQGVQEFSPLKISPFVRVNERLDVDHDNINVFLMDFVTNYQEVLTERIRNKAIVIPPIKLRVEKDLQIDNLDIRTGVI